MSAMADSVAHSPTLAAATRPGERLVPGTRVGDYEIDRFIGAGAMGEVYAGRHPVINKRVAIKVLRHELAASPEAAERFKREARAVNQIEHEHVVDVFGFGTLDDGRHYLVMDLVEGQSLRAKLVHGSLDLDSALAIVDQLASSLDAAHAKGVIHRDLKPDNVVLSNALPPKVFVLDFGLAKLVAPDPIAPGTLTGQGTWLGTPSYMAPEQWSSDGAGPASDRYALGVIAFEMLTGTQPFSATSTPAMMEQHFRASVPTLSSRGVDLPGALDDVLARALAKDPDARYPTAREFARELREAAGSGAQPARRAHATTASARKLWLPAVAGAGVLGVAVIVAVGARPSHDSPARPAAVPADSITVAVESEPANAEIRVDGQLRGKTPKQLAIKARESVDVLVSKPGYLAEKRTVTATIPTIVDVRLAEVTRFKGVWRLANGELRAFERNGDQVDVYKLEEVAGRRAFFKHYPFTATDIGVAFASEDEIVDPRAPDDARCHVRVRVEYRYDPERDTLEQLRDNVVIDVKDGSCVVRSREVQPTTLARVDTPTDTVRVEAPVGVPVKAKPKPAPKAANGNKKALSKLDVTKTATKPTQAYTGAKQPPDSSLGQQNLPPQQAQQQINEPNTKSNK